MLFRNSSAWDCTTLFVIGIACISLIERCANSGTKSGSLLTTSGDAVGRDGAGRLPMARCGAAETAVDSSATESSCSITLRQICAIFFAERFRSVWRGRSAMVVMKAFETKYKGKGSRIIC